LEVDVELLLKVWRGLRLMTWRDWAFIYGFSMALTALAWGVLALMGWVVAWALQGR
jgi:hypothetical protein